MMLYPQPERMKIHLPTDFDPLIKRCAQAFPQPWCQARSLEGFRSKCAKILCVTYDGYTSSIYWLILCTICTPEIYSVSSCGLHSLLRSFKGTSEILISLLSTFNLEGRRGQNSEGEQQYFLVCCFLVNPGTSSAVLLYFLGCGSAKTKNTLGLGFSSPNPRPIVLGFWLNPKRYSSVVVKTPTQHVFSRVLVKPQPRNYSCCVLVEPQPPDYSQASGSTDTIEVELNECKLGQQWAMVPGFPMNQNLGTRVPGFCLNP